MIELQRALIGDHIRNEAFFEALKKVIKPGETSIADIGSGTGFLSFLAERLGASACYLYEYSDMLGMSKKIATANKMKRCHFFQKHSTEEKKPPKVDVVISETLGNFALEENIVENMEDAKRFLKAGGILIPGRLEQLVAPVITPRVWNDVNVWDRVGYNLDLSVAKEAALNNMYVQSIRPADLFERPDAIQKWDEVDFYKKNGSIRKAQCIWRFPTMQKVYGFALWWKAHLVPGITVSTSPYDPATHWEQIFLPLIKPLELKKDEPLELKLTSDSRYNVGINVTWEVNGTIMDMEKGYG